VYCLGGPKMLGDGATRSIGRFEIENAMQVTVQLPDELAPALGDASEMPRKLLEAFAADGYRSGALSRGQVRRLLGLDYWQTDEFLTQHGALREYSLADLEIDRRSLAALAAK
jgi:hypothetical protein